MAAGALVMARELGYLVGEGMALRTLASLLCTAAILTASLS